MAQDPPACSIKGADDVIKRLKAKFKAAFITTKESINKKPSSTPPTIIRCG